jgi:hypothetical protein
MRRHHELDVDDDDDPHRMVRPGERVRVPLMLMDGVQRAVAGVPPPRDLLVTDSRGAPAGHRPGYAFAYAADSADDPRVAAFAERGRYLTDAWRTPIADVGRRALQSHIASLHSAAVDLQNRMDPAAPADEEERDEEQLRHQRDASTIRDAALVDYERRITNSWKTADADTANVERDPEADRWLLVIADPRSTPQQKASARDDLQQYLRKNFGARDGARRYAELTAGMRDAMADPRLAALADRQRQLEDAWRMR